MSDLKPFDDTWINERNKSARPERHKTVHGRKLLKRNYKEKMYNTDTRRYEPVLRGANLLSSLKAYLHDIETFGAEGVEEYKEFLRKAINRMTVKGIYLYNARARTRDPRFQELFTLEDYIFYRDEGEEENQDLPDNQKLERVRNIVLGYDILMWKRRYDPEFKGVKRILTPKQRRFLKNQKRFEKRALLYG